MNSFGRLLRVSILGESHGDLVGIVIDGCPPGLALATEDFLPDLERRRGGKKGTTARKEDDLPVIRSGFFKGRTTGAPILIVIENRDADSRAYEEIRVTPRPGNADFTAHRKFGGYQDYRGGGHFSGRLTAPLVAAGVVAKKLIAPVTVEAALIEVGGSAAIEEAVSRALETGNSIGGVVECRAKGLPVGLGEPFFDSVESLVSHIAFAVPGIKGIEFGAGFAGARMTGREWNDEILNLRGETATNNAGGVNGGITNGNDLVFRVAVKPTSSISSPQRTIHLETGETVDLSVGGRHDTCIALRVPVIMEAVAALVLADLMIAEGEVRGLSGNGSGFPGM